MLKWVIQVGEEQSWYWGFGGLYIRLDMYYVPFRHVSSMTIIEHS